ncbi:hypothetical protein JCM3263A_02860 [Thermobifida fusca]|uniref:Uncharacterized protein n=1 Tax=Thermobifida fusca TM51 TaxID=1169414 RepID=A0A9P2WQJ4_THEFU|nr:MULTISPECIES: hypothetical protein [Thermobifida]EOR70608.1 hypothetical protein TM51_11948 [Thermobifida fusca TM51]MBO2531110.1 hypothetical protein [Thermobifida sp.]PPS92145.1 hypothetical protein BH05_11535 [Thermobifida fusca]PZN60993.1 MAG: hypothetical protein DIU53_14080 [Thermobifida fusca]QOS58844.1 hypothetical protein IM867_16245 [Thermobifida fusca]
MEYRITAELTLPVGATGLDGLQQQGAAALLSEWLDRVATVEGPEGVEITPYDHRLKVSSTGAVVELLVDAPALSFAENGAEALLHEILERTELLADWQVGKCEVTVSDAELAEALEGRPEEEPVATRVGLPIEDVTAQRRRLLALSSRLRAFELESFGPPTEDPDSRFLAAGALIDRASVLTEELLLDIMTLDEEAESLDKDEAHWTADDSEGLFVLHDLPVRYRHHYDLSFAKKFLITASVVYSRLTASPWVPPASTAESLALYLLVENAKELLVSFAAVDPDEVTAMFAVFESHAYRHHDHEWLYLEDLDTADPEDSAADPLGFLAQDAHSWFVPYPDVENPALHPYVIEDDD